MEQSKTKTQFNNPPWYKPESHFSYEDQKWIFANLSLVKAKEAFIPLINDKQNNNTQTNSNPNLNRSVNGSGKVQVKVNEKQDKVTAISLLELCRAKTPRQEVATFLEIVFSSHESQDGHWLYIARTYTPKTINSVIRYMVKRYTNGEIDLDNPNSYFTYVIQRKKKRKEFRDTNGGRKRQVSNMEADS
jgi:hypothetical protein